MTITRTYMTLILTTFALLITGQAAQADHLKDIFRTIRHVHVEIGGSGHHKHGHGHSLPPGYGFPIRDCHQEICPPTPPVSRCLYCVYYLDCHGCWKLYGCYHSRWTANSAERQLEYQGLRTYVKVKHIGGRDGYPGGLSGPPILFGR